MDSLGVRRVAGRWRHTITAAPVTALPLTVNELEVSPGYPVRPMRISFLPSSQYLALRGASQSKEVRIRSVTSQCEALFAHVSKGIAYANPTRIRSLNDPIPFAVEIDCGCVREEAIIGHLLRN